jgi:tRNA threonylcarbamoyladenosine biosynthesis protein TsaB
MRVLLIDTAGSEGSIALADTEFSPTVVAAEALPGRTSSERLVPVLKRLMERRGWRLRELAAIVVVHGPGSFTGVRVGLSAAKGLSEASGVPLIAVSRLAVLAASVNDRGGQVHAVLDAGRGEFYYGEYAGQSLVREALMNRQDVVTAVGDGLVVACETKMAEALSVLVPRMMDEPLAGYALPIALQRIRDGNFDDAATLDANYLRKIDAEIFAKAAAGMTVR